MASDLETRIRHVTAVLGPTNTGKTHLAIERLLGHESGMIGLPLRLLAREVYDKIAARVGADKVALITGEEKIKPERARYWVATVEAMPRDIEVDFLAIDEVQLAADPERGHVFTDRLLNARGRAETLLLGAATMREAIADLIPGANFIARPRLSKLSYAGEKKITRMPQRSAVVAFSANDVYSIAELIRRQRGGAAVVLGALSPRTRNAQVALYQSGDVDFLVATDAIGMGLNLDVNHVAFSATRKFDGQNFRNLTPGELGQIAGRAGRHMNDGTFGVTGSAEPLEQDVIERLETHNFDNVKVLQWRNRDLDLTTLEGLRDSLRAAPREQRLVRARMADDVAALETVSSDRELANLVRSPAAVAKLWDVCQVPDYRKISGNSHAELVATLFRHLMTGDERIPEDWFAKQVEQADRTDGDIDTLATRIAHIRTWTFVSNRPDWLRDPGHWQGQTRAIEDKLSDALHELLTQRFVDQRTSALMKGMRDKDELSADIGEDGTVHVETHKVGRLKGFRFMPDPDSLGDTVNGKAARNAAAQVLARELGMRVRRVASAKPDAFKLTRAGLVLWRDEEIAKVEAGADPLKPVVTLLCDEHLQASDKEKVQVRLDTWIGEIVADKLKPLADIAAAEDIAGLGRGIAFRLVENLGALKRETIGEEIKSLDQTARAQLRKYGVRFGAFNIFFPLLLKPAASELALTLWGLKHAGRLGLTPETLPEPPRAGLTSTTAEAGRPEEFYRACGYHLCGPRVIRLDILERLADLIRPMLAWRPNPENPSAPPPKGSTGDGGFTITPEMMSILGCSQEELGSVLKALGFKLERRPAAKRAGSAEGAATVADFDAGSAALAAAVSLAGGEVAQASESPAAMAPPPATDVSEGSEAGNAAEGADDEAAASEVEMEDVWRPRRHRHERGERPERSRGRDRHRGGPQRNVGPASSQTGAQEPSAGSAAAATVEDGGRGTAEAQAGESAREGRPHDGRRQDRERRRGDERERREERPRHGQRSGGDRPDRGPRGGQDGGRDRGRDDSRRGRDDRRPSGPKTITAAPPPRKGPVDPDSPFAKLGALREALEKRTKEPSNG